MLRLGLHRLPIGEFPLLRGLAPVLAAYDGAAELERGLDILLTGLTTTVTPPGQTRPLAIIAAHAAETGRTILSRDAKVRFGELPGVSAIDA